jgi:hypothetical protein
MRKQSLLLGRWRNEKKGGKDAKQDCIAWGKNILFTMRLIQEDLLTYTCLTEVLTKYTEASDGIS